MVGVSESHPANNLTNNTFDTLNRLNTNSQHFCCSCVCLKSMYKRIPSMKQLKDVQCYDM